MQQPFEMQMKWNEVATSAPSGARLPPAHILLLRAPCRYVGYRFAMCTRGAHTANTLPNKFCWFTCCCCCSHYGGHCCRCRVACRFNIPKSTRNQINYLMKTLFFAAIFYFHPTHHPPETLPTNYLGACFWDTRMCALTFTYAYKACAFPMEVAHCAQHNGSGIAI